LLDTEHSDGTRVPLELTGHLEADGTIEGEADAANGPEKWTGERSPKA
jgi:hypothetical protein